MPSNEDVTLGEIFRGLGDLRGDVKELTKTIVAKPDWNDLKDTRAALEASIAAEEASRKAERLVADKAIAALEDWNKWAVRIVLGAAGSALVVGGINLAVAAAGTAR